MKQFVVIAVLALAAAGCGASVHNTARPVSTTTGACGPDIGTTKTAVEIYKAQTGSYPKAGSDTLAAGDNAIWVLVPKWLTAVPGGVVVSNDGKGTVSCSLR